MVGVVLGTLEQRICAAFEAKVHDSQVGVFQGTEAVKTELHKLGKTITSQADALEFLKTATLDEIAELVKLASIGRPEPERRKLEAFAAFLRGGR